MSIICLRSKEGVKARKSHRCDFCGEKVNIGERYDIRVGADHHGLWTMRMHPECHKYEQKDGIVDPDWYEDISEPAFYREDAIKNV